MKITLYTCQRIVYKKLFETLSVVRHERKNIMP